MHIVVISGSHRPKSNSHKVAEFCAATLRKEPDTTADVLALANNPLPLWESEGYVNDPSQDKFWKPIQEKLKAADGFVVISPEWHGMVPAGLKNLFLFATKEDVGHKPAQIVTVSASRGGAYPVDELRISSYKNSRILYLPDHVIVRDAGNMLNEPTPAGKDDEFVRNRLAWSLKILLAYAKAIKPVRDSGIVFSKEFGTGM